MRPDSVELPVGIVFRRLHSAPGAGGRWTWFGLWDLPRPAERARSRGRDPGPIRGGGAVRLGGADPRRLP